MPDLTPIRPALDALRAALEALYGERLVRLVLFGSWARGEAHAESDVDVLVVLRGPVNAAEEIARMNGPAFEIGLRHGLLLSTPPMSEEAFERGEAALLRDVRAEGLAV
jgi:predicted nucleotidyltransferase